MSLLNFSIVTGDHVWFSIRLFIEKMAKNSKKKRKRKKLSSSSEEDERVRRHSVFTCCSDVDKILCFSHKSIPFYYNCGWNSHFRPLHVMNNISLKGSCKKCVSVCLSTHTFVFSVFKNTLQVCRSVVSGCSWLKL